MRSSQPVDRISTTRQSEPWCSRWPASGSSRPERGRLRPTRNFFPFGKLAPPARPAADTFNLLTGSELCRSAELAYILPVSANLEEPSMISRLKHVLIATAAVAALAAAPASAQTFTLK